MKHSWPGNVVEVKGGGIVNSRLVEANCEILGLTDLLANNTPSQIVK